ncbi:MAG TPA: hypothetical protein VFB82_01820 [Blastocatellia bacterium]|jgi:hypothetical protein|nr:hypothetical protein [Blastocatellia bacterium]
MRRLCLVLMRTGGELRACAAKIGWWPSAQSGHTCTQSTEFNFYNDAI